MGVRSHVINESWRSFTWIKLSWELSNLCLPRYCKIIPKNTKTLAVMKGDSCISGHAMKTKLSNKVSTGAERGSFHSPAPTPPAPLLARCPDLPCPLRTTSPLGLSHTSSGHARAWPMMCSNTHTLLCPCKTLLNGSANPEPHLLPRRFDRMLRQVSFYTNSLGLELSCRGSHREEMTLVPSTF